MMFAVGLLFQFSSRTSATTTTSFAHHVGTQSCIYGDYLASFGNFSNPASPPKTPMTPLRTPPSHPTTLSVTAQVSLGALFLAMLMLCGSCATSPHHNNEAAALEKPGCISPCPDGYECSS